MFNMFDCCKKKKKEADKTTIVVVNKKEELIEPLPPNSEHQIFDADNVQSEFADERGQEQNQIIKNQVALNPRL